MIVNIVKFELRVMYGSFYCSQAPLPLPLFRTVSYELCKRSDRLPMVQMLMLISTFKLPSRPTERHILRYGYHGRGGRGDLLEVELKIHVFRQPG